MRFIFCPTFPIAEPSCPHLSISLSLSICLFLSPSFSFFLSLSLSPCSYVGQEPTLFSGSVSENISKGRAECGGPILSLQEVMAEGGTKGFFSFLPKKVHSSFITPSTSISTFDDHIQAESKLDRLESGLSTLGKPVVSCQTDRTMECPISDLFSLFLSPISIYYSSLSLAALSLPLSLSPFLTILSKQLLLFSHLQASLKMS